jgi:hypothetical protein
MLLAYGTEHWCLTAKMALPDRGPLLPPVICLGSQKFPSGSKNRRHVRSSRHVTCSDRTKAQQHREELSYAYPGRSIAYKLSGYLLLN